MHYHWLRYALLILIPLFGNLTEGSYVAFYRPMPSVCCHRAAFLLLFAYTLDIIIFTKLADYGMIQSLSRTGKPYDNAVIESFFSSTKREYTSEVAFRKCQISVLMKHASHFTTCKKF